ncbi:uncharacterized protein LOC119667808 [Teleopsis dalmanni]|uniref:uncharacterized protein LOC119667808 n=1 Tax=Teleopsis dalmanni TaxID=139649 RepID=UPI0018CFAB66|nr:uncharacterized protein LOC119667808 [Teleopsis dalmanni]
MNIFVKLALITLIAATAKAAHLSVISQDENVPSAPLPSTGAAVDEVVVESSLYIKPKPKPNVRRIRSIPNIELASLIEHKRVKRIPRRQNNAFQQPEYGQSQAAANAAANNNYQNPFGFGASQANAQSQAFNAQGPSGSFGASSAGSVTQALNANKFGIQNSAGASLAQTYTLPNRQTINFASTNSFANSPLANANSRGSSVSVSQPIN